MDAAYLARRFALGGAARRSDGPVAVNPNPRSPRRADSAAWIGQVLEQPHTREQLDSLLLAVR